MRQVGVFEGKTRFSALIVDAERGETTVVTKNGRPVAQIAPVSGVALTRGRQAAERLKSLGGRLRSEGKTTGIDIRASIDEGRS